MLDQILRELIDLLRSTSLPVLLEAFPTTTKVTTHRLRVTELSQLDESITDLLDEAWSTVVPGTR